MKIHSVRHNNRRKSFEESTAKKTFQIPYSKTHPKPTSKDPVMHATVDRELAREGFTYVLASGKEGSIHIDQILEYNQDPHFLRDALLCKLTMEARKRAQASRLSKREIIRRLGTSATQLYRLLDQK